MDAMRLVILGAAGRMGRTLVRLVHEAPGLQVSAALERPGSIALGTDAGQLAGAGHLGIPVTDDLDAALSGADGVIDFTAPAASVALARETARRGLVHVIGTTGCSAEDNAAIAESARVGARIVKSGNMSLGVNLLAVLVEQAARALGPDAFDIEVLEMHHRHKVDAPSGTALLLGQAAAEGRGIDLAASAVRSRDGHTGARPEGTIGFATLRGGSVVGDHEVILAGEGERITLAHHAEDRAIFARGALRAALWAKDRPPGLYSMRDVLGL
ncbi:4-hydroxy-tetrahydrodipicolinate reductase [Aureimonas sp. SK2]|uniref:4-hydroxy-tetrahydrodipicolinate reductase n=1 Tax=Aureimonas sp. SK2 TaxID=3015992 RepID=UPI002445225D|nr:4-hydroxy-tetrahydrodipicolinate reductase [Aureimonas sp. SK2]